MRKKPRSSSPINRYMTFWLALKAAQLVLLGELIGPAEAVVSAALGFWAAEAPTMLGFFFWWARGDDYQPAYARVNGEQVDKFVTDEFIAGRHHADEWSSVRADPLDAERRQHAEVARLQLGAGPEHRLVGLHVFAGAADGSCCF